MMTSVVRRGKCNDLLGLGNEFSTFELVFGLEGGGQISEGD